MKRSPTLSTLAALGLLAALPVAATAADGLNYNHVEAGYVATNGDTDADGWGVNASAALTPNFHLFGSHSSQDLDPAFGIDSADADQWRLGVGYNHGIGANTDLLARVAYDKYEADNVTIGGVNYGGSEVDGYSAEVGVRSALAPALEGHALVGYEDGADFDGAFYGRLGAQLKLDQRWGLSGDVKFAEGNTQWFVGPRLSW